jgi:DNA-binding GntR family transcriptional regulator
MKQQKIPQIEKKSLAQEVYFYLRNGILTGALAPGTRLLESQIAAEMKVSRAPVREALRSLEADRLIEFHVNQGSTVREMKPEEISEIYTARYVIEGYLATLAATRATPEDLKRLKKTTMQAVKAAESGNLEDTINADFETHRLIWEISGHKLFYDILLHLEIQIRLFMSLQAVLFTNLFDSVKEHQDIYTAIASKDPDATRRCIQHHIIEAGLMALGRTAQANQETSPFILEDENLYSSK